MSCYISDTGGISTRAVTLDRVCLTSCGWLTFTTKIRMLGTWCARVRFGVQRNCLRLAGGTELAVPMTGFVQISAHGHHNSKPHA